MGLLLDSGREIEGGQRSPVIKSRFEFVQNAILDVKPL